MPNWIRILLLLVIELFFACHFLFMAYLGTLNPNSFQMQYVLDEAEQNSADLIKSVSWSSILVLYGTLSPSIFMNVFFADACNIVSLFSITLSVGKFLRSPLISMIVSFDVAEDSSRKHCKCKVNCSTVPLIWKWILVSMEIEYILLGRTIFGIF